MSLKIKPSMWKDLPLKEYIYVSLGMIAISTTAILILNNNLPPVVPFFYGKAVGEGQLVKSLGLLAAPGLSLLIIVLNTVLTATIENNFFKKILIMCAFLFSLLMTITVFKIVFLVGFF